MYFLSVFNTTNASSTLEGPFTSRTDARDTMLSLMAEDAETDVDRMKEIDNSSSGEGDINGYYVSIADDCGCVGNDNRIYYSIHKVGENDVFPLKSADLEERFRHYIERKKYNQAQRSDSQDGLYSAGEIKEAEKWLTLFGVDLSYIRIQPMIEGKKEIRTFDPIMFYYTVRYFHGRKHNGEYPIVSRLAKDDFLDEDAFINALIKEGTVDAASANYIVGIDGGERFEYVEKSDE